MAKSVARKPFMKPGYRVAASLFLATWAVSPAHGSEARAPGTAAEYFGPLREGRVFVYQVGDRARRLVRIVRVARDPHGGARVDTESQVEGLGRAGPPPETYHLDSRNDAVYQSWASRPEEKTAILKGPVRPGTRWDVAFRTEKPALRFKGTCRIDRVAARTVLGKEAPCAEVVCDVSAGDGLASTTRRTFCKDIGHVGTESTATAPGRPPRSLRERLVEIR